VKRVPARGGAGRTAVGTHALPLGHESDVRAFVRLAGDIVLVGAVFIWQIRRISMAELPELRAIEALGIVVALFLAAFSGIYVAMSHESAATFTQPLDHTRVAIIGALVRLILNAARSRVAPADGPAAGGAS
jgi:hypothetical protein